MAALLAEFNAYLDRDDADPAADLVGYQQRAVWLSRDELLGMISELRSAIAPRLANQAMGFASMPTLRIPSFLHSTRVVPVPQNGSRTHCPALTPKRWR